MTADTVPRLGNLPAEPNSFVGRERDLSDLALLLGSVRALTLCGPGGIGKTRLAVRLGWQLGDDFPDGVWLAELAELTDPGLTARQIATVLGIGEEPGQPLAATLVDALRGRQLLLILDTCEHVVDAVADLVRTLIAGCPQLRLVATSREPLRVRGETVWRVPPLALPAPAVPGLAAGLQPQHAADEAASPEAVQLFVDRAAAVRPGFSLTAENYSQVLQLCRTLDGVPLAIELAAARIRALSVEQIAGRIDDRFRLLASGDRTAPPRQQTLLAAVEWSYSLLTPDEQVLLRRLSVFSGWSLEQAEQVCAGDQIGAQDILDLLAALIDKSLVALDEEVGGDARYRLLDTIRQYAAARLSAAGEDDVFRRRHRDHFLNLVEAVTGRAFVRGALPWDEQVRLYHRVAGEQANLRAALGYCLETADAEAGLRLCVALRSPWVVQGDVTEGLSWFGRFLSLPAWAPATVRAHALMFGAELAFEHQDYPAAIQRATAAAALHRSCPGVCLAGALRLLALISLRAGQPAEALDRADAAVAAAVQYADEWEQGLALSARATILARAGQFDAAGESYTAALELLAGNNGWGIANVLTGFGSLARARGDVAGALERFGSALAIFRQIDARTEIARCLAGIGGLELAAGDLTGAAASLASSLELSMAAGQRLGIARGLEAIAALAVARADYEAALRLAGAAAGLRAALDPAGPAARRHSDALLAGARQYLDASAAADLMTAGERLSTHEAVAFALSLAGAPAERAASVPLAGALAGIPRPAPPGLAGRRLHPAAPGPAGQRPRPAGSRPPVSVLTAREQEIALLIARGLSNRSIAEQLFISPATAARHVANILGKLGLRSRAQVAVWTAEHLAAGGFGPAPQAPA